MHKNIIFSLIFIIFLSSCDKSSKLPQLSDQEQFVKYWFTGNAELNTYKLDQAHLGSMQKGSFILVFMTEDFRTDKQVKYESFVPKGRSSTVLKMNSIRRFQSGIYDFSSMTSVFMPVSVNDFPNALKISNSMQDWDGQSYSQLNFKQNGYQYIGRSYIENAVDDNIHIDKGVAEDELINAIRLRPDRLEIGDKMMIPSLFSLNIRHKKITPILAKLKLYDYKESHFAGNKLKVYEVDYKGDDRNLKIVFENIFPFRILGFEETYKQKDVYMTSRAKLIRSLKTPFLQDVLPKDSLKRKEMLLPNF